jgi:hypothetical protein
VFQSIGIGEEVKKKTVVGMQGSQVAAALADDRAEIGQTFISEMLPNKGVKIAGPLPAAVQNAPLIRWRFPRGVPIGTPRTLSFKRW